MTVDSIAATISAAAAVVAILYSIYTFNRQQARAEAYARASVKPLLSMKSQNYDDLKSIRIMNYGVGPAVIRKAEFRRRPEDLPTDNIVDLFNLNIKWEEFVNVPSQRAIPAEGEIMLIKESLPHLLGQVPDKTKALAILEQWREQKTGIQVRIEYEDIYGNLMPLLKDTLN